MNSADVEAWIESILTVVHYDMRAAAEADLRKMVASLTPPEGGQVSEPMWCEVRQHYCRCHDYGKRCDDWDEDATMQEAWDKPASPAAEEQE